jgi:hypothetical protein
LNPVSARLANEGFAEKSFNHSPPFRFAHRSLDGRSLDDIDTAKRSSERYGILADDQIEVSCRMPLPLGLACHKQYPGRRRRNIFAPDLCTEKALQYQWPNFGAEFLEAARNQGEGLFAVRAADR